MAGRTAQRRSIHNSTTRPVVRDQLCCLQRVAGASELQYTNSTSSVRPLWAGGTACRNKTNKQAKIFSAVNNFFADSPLVNQLKGIMVRKTRQASNTEPGPPDENQENRGPPTVNLAVSPSESQSSVRSLSPSRQRQVNFLKPAANTTLDRKASIIDETTGITRTQMKEFREAFRLFDKDGDGTITKEELGRVMRSLGQFARVEELQDMLQEVDSDGDGNVSFEEFVNILSKSMSGSGGNTSSAEQEERELRDAFRVFDKHNRGYICASDLRAVLQCLGEDLSEEEIEDMIKEVDSDGDGRIDFLEFVRALGEPEDACDDEEDDDLIDADISQQRSVLAL
ncbi:calcium-binding protein 2-like isoform X1 [Colias croceus]|uniref:calcium-binding protein 2-like isoform X1 n=1 Tax=Colias crocea TaxID=72248 RepID=UPI001E27C70D|nr:calcium-binding protein 2-like isoform X1 [Colias croceus]XP_045503087.1 calcium-binding protein 2-like isoform X1 [Colias croceus]